MMSSGFNQLKYLRFSPQQVHHLASAEMRVQSKSVRVQLNHLFCMKATMIQLHKISLYYQK